MRSEKSILNGSIMNTCIIPADQNKSGKKTMQRAFIASLFGILALSGCGGGGGGQSSTPANNSQTAAKPILVEEFGDSTTVGCTLTAGSSGQASCIPGYSVAYYNEPATVRAILRSQFGDSISVTNNGYAGTTLSNLINGTGGFTATWAAQMAASKANIVLVNFGINDAYEGNTTPAQFVAEIDDVVTVAKSAGKTVVLQTSNPVTAAQSAPYLPALVSAEIAEAQRLGVTVVDENGFLLSQADWQATLPDGIHPSNSEYELLSHNQASVLAPIVQSML